MDFKFLKWVERLKDKKQVKFMDSNRTINMPLNQKRKLFQKYQDQHKIKHHFREPDLVWPPEAKTPSQSSSIKTATYSTKC